MNRIRIVNWSHHFPVSETEVRDLVDVLYRYDGDFTICGQMRSGEKKPLHGLHVYNAFFGGHEIYLDIPLIEESCRAGRRAGGNRKVSDPRLGIGMVLAHELQHANQHRIHASASTAFFGSKRSRYLTRPCEREARQFADDSIGQIAAVLDTTLPLKKAHHVPQDELREVVESLLECGMVSHSDITEELRLSGLNNAMNFQKVKTILTERGVEVC